MNPDASRQAMDRTHKPCMNGVKAVDDTAFVGDSSLKKQLPLQQTSKPLHRFRTSETKTVLFGHGEAISNMPVFPGYQNAGSIYCRGSVMDISGDKDSPVHLTSHRAVKSQQNLKQHFFTVNPYMRPVSASDVAARVNSNSLKHALAASLAVSSLPEMSSMPPQSPSLQRNSFLRPLTESASTDTGQASSNTGNNSLTKPEFNGSLTPHRHSRNDSDFSLSPFVNRYGTKHRAHQNAALITEHSRNTGSSFSKRPSVSNSISFKENRPFSGTVKIDGNVQCPMKSNIDYKDTKHNGSQYDMLSHSYGAFPSISLEPNTPTALTISKIADHNQSLTPKSTLNITGVADSLSFQKMSAVNTLAGSVYYRRHSEPRSSSILSSGNKNSSNVTPEYLHEPVNVIGIPAASLMNQSSALSSGSCDKARFSGHSRIKPLTQETISDRTQVKSGAMEHSTDSKMLTKPLLNGEKSRDSKMLTKPFLNGEKSRDSKMLTKSLLNGEKSRDSKILTKPLLNGEKSTDSKMLTKPLLNSGKTIIQTPDCPKEMVKKMENGCLITTLQSGMVTTKRVPASSSKATWSIEQRSIGDGAPSGTKKSPEKSNNRTDTFSTTSEVDCDDNEESSDDDDADDESDEASSGTIEEEGHKGESRSQESFSKGERLPGDGEANSEMAYENDDLESIDDTKGDSASFETSSIKISNFGHRERPVTADSAHILSQDNSRPDNCQKPTVRPVTAMASAVIKPAFRYSLFEKIPPTINFVLEGEKTEPLPLEMSRLLKWKMSPITPIVVKAALIRVGFKITKKNHDWLGCFGKHMKSHCFKLLHEYQKLNHFPGSFQIGRKDKLWRSLSKMQIHFGKQEFNFFPQTFVLPGDMKLLKQAWDDGTSKQKWIIKPPASARGIGIRVINKWTQIPKQKPFIVQKYIHRPFLINGSKFDMRIYVYVTCYDPLRLYVYEDGLARFASCRYSSSSKTLNNRFMHLTNYSVNKNNSDYLNNTDSTVCQGHKWSLKALWNYMKKQGINTNLIWETIRDLIIKTIISGEPVINSMTKSNTCSRYCCHELFGFDILLDENFKPWILEVNISPSLHSNSQLDLSIKGGMIKDMLNMAGFRLPDERDIGSIRSDSSAYSPVNTYSMDRRLFTTQLAPDERTKHTYYCQRYMDELTNLTNLGSIKALWAYKVLKTAYLKKHMQALSSILNILTPDDVRLLCESIDEDNRKGNFQRLFPTPTTHRYLRYFEQARYYNLLLDQWVLHYNHKEQNGIQLLQTLCAKKIHLQNPTTDGQHQKAALDTQKKKKKSWKLSASIAVPTAENYVVIPTSCVELSTPQETWSAHWTPACATKPEEASVKAKTAVSAQQQQQQKLNKLSHLFTSPSNLVQ